MFSAPSPMALPLLSPSPSPLLLLPLARSMSAAPATVYLLALIQRPESSVQGKTGESTIELCCKLFSCFVQKYFHGLGHP